MILRSGAKVHQTGDSKNYVLFHPHVYIPYNIVFIYIYTQRYRIYTIFAIYTTYTSEPQIRSSWHPSGQDEARRGSAASFASIGVHADGWPRWQKRPEVRYMSQGFFLRFVSVAMFS